MSEKLQTLAVHAACVFVICVCFALAELTSLRTVWIMDFPSVNVPGLHSVHVPVLSRVLEVSGFFIWGKLGFKPAQVVLERLLQGMDATRIEQIMSQRPPANVPKIPTPPPPAGIH